MNRKLCLGCESYWSNCHDKKIEYKASEASKSQNPSNDSTNDGQKCSAAQINKSSNFSVSRLTTPKTRIKKEEKQEKKKRKEKGKEGSAKEHMHILKSPKSKISNERFTRAYLC